jgi:hypothetical protein
MDSAGANVADTAAPTGLTPNLGVGSEAMGSGRVDGGAHLCDAGQVYCPSGASAEASVCQDTNCNACTGFTLEPNAGDIAGAADVCCADVLRSRPRTDFSMCAGEFLECYSTEDNLAAWDSVVTCFFIDTAVNILDYIELMTRILKPGGMWINQGPLLYHWQNSGGDSDDRYQKSVELSYEEIKAAMMVCGFTFLEETRRECPYTSNVRSMYQVCYAALSRAIFLAITCLIKPGCTWSAECGLRCDQPVHP